MNVAAHPYISLFTGAAGLDLAVRIALPGTRCLLYVENEATAARILAARIKEGSIDDAPIWSDVRTFPGALFRGRVAGIVGGFPCTDLSVAGRQAGITGEKSGLWFEYAQIIREVQPRWVFIENVPPVLHVGNGGAVLGELARMGFDAEWGTLSAAAVGASHLRKRVFILAYRAERGCRKLWESSRGNGFADGRGADVADSRIERIQLQQRDAWAEHSGSGGDVADCKRGRWGEGVESSLPTWRCEDGQDAWSGSDDVVHPERAERRPHAERGGHPQPWRNGQGEAAGGAGERGEAVGNAHQRNYHWSGSGGARRRRELADDGGSMGHALGAGLEIGRCQPGDAGEERETVERAGAEGLFAPGPGDPRWPALLVRRPWLRPAISQAEAESHLRGVADGLADLAVRERTDALRATGNGVVPLQAAAMLTELIRRAGGI
ncbi:MAG: DNA cytosine methyltransferase [Desulfurellales bacterium]|nr:MAG: DNA cytosine methyltransferase [Desulfurellales bacterium]